MAKHLSEQDVGNYFIDDRGDVWQCESYCPSPTVSFKRIHPAPSQFNEEPDAAISGAVGSPIVSGLTRLIKEER